MTPQYDVYGNIIQALCHLCGRPLNLSIKETPGGVHPSCADYEAALDAAKNETEYKEEMQ